MKLLKILKTVLLCIALVAIGCYALMKYENRRVKPDYYEVYKTQDTIPEGRVGIFVTALIMPETLDPDFFLAIHRKIAENVIPWPFRLFALADRGVALMDPERYIEFEEFTPTRLEDCQGSDRAPDGETYIEKYRRGEVTWHPPMKRRHKDLGYFVYTGVKGNMPTAAGKLINKARIWYYDRGIVQKKLPHWQGSFAIIEGAMEKIEKKYGSLPWKAESSLYYDRMKRKLHELLDAGCDTIVLVAPMAIYSHFEEFNSGFYHSFEYIHEWEQAHPGKKIKVIMAPPMGQFEVLREAYIAMLADRLDTLPEGADVTVAVTVHGMPWERFAWEAWLEFAPPYRDAMVRDVEALLERYPFDRTKVVLCQDEYASHVFDPDDEYLSTNEAYWNAIDDNYDYAIGLPIEFFAENSDSLFYHALKNYEGFDDYNVYEPFDYPDWSKPFVMEFTQGTTTVIYNGVPVGKYRRYLIDALSQSIDSILAQQRPAAD